MVGAIALMLALIFVALGRQTDGARKRLSEIKNLQAQEMAFNNEEQERRQKGLSIIWQQVRLRRRKNSAM